MSDGAPDNPPAVATVPKARLDEALTKLRAANARVSELERAVATATEAKEAAEATGRSANQLADRVKDLEKQIAAERAERAEDNDIRAAGFDDADLARFEHGRATRGDKDAPSVVDWLKGLDAETAPPALRGSLPEPEGEPAPSSAPRGTTNRSTQPADPAPPSQGETTNDRLRNIAARHPVGSAEWAAEARAALPAGHPLADKR